MPFMLLLLLLLYSWCPRTPINAQPLNNILNGTLISFYAAAASPVQLVSYNPNERPTAGEALLHRWFEQMPVVAGMATPSGTGSVLVTSSVAAATAVRSISNTVGSTVGTVGKRVTEAIPTGGWCSTAVGVFFVACYMTVGFGQVHDHGYP
jgi:hypothetical protein